MKWQNNRIKDVKKELRESTRQLFDLINRFETEFLRLIKGERREKRQEGHSRCYRAHTNHQRNESPKSKRQPRKESIRPLYGSFFTFMIPIRREGRRRSILPDCNQTATTWRGAFEWNIY